jgi:hypothetical protein
MFDGKAQDNRTAKEYAWIFRREIEARKYLADDGIHWANDGFEMASRAWRKAMDQVNFAVLDRAD